MKAIVCGRVIGEASARAIPDELYYQFYDFIPSAGYSGPVAIGMAGACISFDFATGVITAYSGDGEIITSDKDLIECIRRCPKA